MRHQSPCSSGALLAIDNLSSIEFPLEMNQDSGKRQNTGFGANDIGRLRVLAAIIRPVDDTLKRRVVNDGEDAS